MSTHSHAMRHAPIRNGRSKFPRTALATQDAQKFRYVLLINNGVNDTVGWLRAVVGCSGGGNMEFWNRNVTFPPPRIISTNWRSFMQTLNFRHRASSIQDRCFATLQRTLFIYLINKYISLSDICLTVNH